MVFLKNTELNLDSALKKACRLIGKNRPIISLYKTPRYNDEPQFFQYTALIKKTSVKSNKEEDNENLAGGTAILKERAIMKALGEGIERYCLATFQRKDFVQASIKQLKEDYLNPASVVNFSERQLKNKPLNAFRFYKDTRFSWIKGYSLSSKKPILVPTQLVYVPYYTHDEPIIRLPITTGAACNTSLDEAMLGGICEIIERDSFMIFYLNKLSPARLDLAGSRDVSLISIFNSYKRYSLELYVFDISTDLPFTSIMAIIIDRNGIGPAVSVGLKCSVFPEVAIVGAIEEAQQIRSWIRDEMCGHKESIGNFDSLDLKERGLYWSKIDRIKDLDFFLDSKNTIQVDGFIRRLETVTVDFDSLIRVLKRKKIEVMFVDVTTTEIRKKGFVVVKVIIPQLQPLYLCENFRYLGGQRLYRVPRLLGYSNTPKNETDLNSKPHPFL